MILNKPNKIRFDVNNPQHLTAYRNFYERGNWNPPCQFELEAPYESIPSMITDKIIRKTLEIKNV